MLQGKIKKLVVDKGFGFIEGGSKGDLFFHHSMVDGTQFEDLREGQAVEFEEEGAPKAREPKTSELSVELVSSAKAISLWRPRHT